MPPRQRNRRKKVEEANFLFVNEDANTVTRVGKDAEQDRLKQSHVQRRNFAQRQQSKTEAGRSIHAPERNNDTAPDESIRPPLTTQEQATDAATAGQGLRQGGLTATVPGQPTLGANTILGSVSSSGVHNSINHYHIYPPATPAATSRAIKANEAQVALNNPLRSFTLHPLLSDRFELLQKWAPPLMRYWTTVLLPEKFYADSRCVPLREMRHVKYVHNEMERIMQNPAHMYSFLANISIQMLGKEGQLLLPSANPVTSQSDPNSSRIPDIFQNHAIHAIRQELSKNTLTHAIVNDVHYLMSAAYHAGQFDAALPHYRAMLRMITALGGLTTFSPYFIETMFLMHWSASLKRLVRPTLPVASFDPGHGPPEIRSLVTQVREANNKARTGSVLPTSTLQSLAATTLLSPPLLSHAQSLADVTQFARWAEQQQSPPYNPTYYKWIDTRHIAIGYHLLSTEPDVIYGKLNEAVRIALIFTVALTRSPESGARCASSSVERLKALLEASGDGGVVLRGLWGDVPNGTETLLWVCVVGGLVAGGKNKGAREWFREVAGGCTAVLGLSGGYTLAASSSTYKFQSLLSGMEDEFEIENLDLGVGPGELAPELFINSITTTPRIPSTSYGDAIHFERDFNDIRLETDMEQDDDAPFEPDDDLFGTTAVATSQTSETGGMDPQKEEWRFVQDIMFGFVWDEALQGEKLRLFWEE